MGEIYQSKIEVDKLGQGMSEFEQLSIILWGSIVLTQIVMLFILGKIVLRMASNISPCKNISNDESSGTMVTHTLKDAPLAHLIKKGKRKKRKKS